MRQGLTFCSMLLAFALVLLTNSAFADKVINIPILCYHNFNPTTPGSMNLTPQKLESQIKWIKDNGYTVIPLKEAVAYLQGQRSSLPPKSVVITADDGWASVYTYLLPLVKKYNIPVTLFIYPGTISEGKHAMTWEELKELQKTGLFDIQGHTYTHPNFKHEKKDHSADRYAQEVQFELAKSKQVLEDKLNIKIAYLAWPFGIYNDYLEDAAAKAGYDMAFTIDAIPATRDHRPMAQPRYMIVDGLSTKTFQNIIKQANS